MKISDYRCKRLNRKMWKFTGHFPHFGRRTRIGFTSEKDAREAAHGLWAEGQRRAYGLIPPEAPRVTLRQLMEKASGKARPQAARFLARWLATLPAGMLVTELETAHFRDFADARLKGALILDPKANRFREGDGVKASPQTVFRELTDVFSVLNSAHEYFPALKDWRAPKRPKIEGIPEGGRVAFYAPDRTAELLRVLMAPRGLKEQTLQYAARLDCADWFLLALLTRLRSSELRTRRWADVNFNWRTVNVSLTKVRRESTVKVSALCVEILRRRKERVGAESDYIFFSRRDLSRPVKRFTTDILKRACQAVGIPWGYKDPSGVVLHTTRHSAVTAMLESGAQLEAARRAIGHTKKTMTLRYGQVSVGAEDEAVRSLDVFAEPLSGLLSTETKVDSANSANSAVKKTRVRRKTG